MDGVREIIIEAGNILKDKYMSSFMVHEKEKGHLAAEDFEFAENYIRNIQFDDYDLLIQLCDALSLDTGFCLL